MNKRQNLTVVAVASAVVVVVEILDRPVLQH